LPILAAVQKKGIRRSFGGPIPLIHERELSERQEINLTPEGVSYRDAEPESS
jgi:hypothetical protein